MMRPRRWAASLDMYRKVPVDLMEGTKRGSILSVLALFTIAMLFLLETKAFLSSRWTTSLMLDDNEEQRIRLNFNITMMDLRCEFAVVDVVSVLGTDQNVTASVTKWNVDAEGIRQRFQGRNRDQKDILLKDDKIEETIEELLEDGEDAVSLDEETFDYALKQNEYLFLDFYAGWCSHCRDLAPTWEILAEVMNDAAEEILENKDHEYNDEEYEHAKSLEKPVMVAKIDCVDHHDFCLNHNIRAYPTLRLFIDGQRYDKGDYRGDRTVVAMADWLHKVEEEHKEGTDAERKVHIAFEQAKELMGEEEREWNDKVHRRKRDTGKDWLDQDHPGCQIAGHLMLDRVPGNFHIQARSPHHDIVPHMTNVSHVIHHLSIGEPLVRRMAEDGSVYVPPDVQEKLAPVDGNVYVTYDLHESFHHYLKVITTNVEGLATRHRTLNAYQILQSSQLAFYRNDVVPEAKFIFDLSPIKVTYGKTSRHWYDYLTSVFAIVGGTFSVVGMLEGSIHAAASRSRRRF